MSKLDRTELLHALDQRHDQLLVQLDELNEQIDRVLATIRVEPAPPAATHAADRVTYAGLDARSC